MKQVIFVIPPTVQILDLAGPVQAFDEARIQGADYRLRFAGIHTQVQSAQRLTLANLEPFENIETNPDDLLIIAGIHRDQLGHAALATLGDTFYDWLHECHKGGAKLATICNATFILAFSGLLDGRKCTTHWVRLAMLQEHFPKLDVLDNRLFVKDGPFFSSAGICSGIDLALAMIEEDCGPLLANKVAQHLVIYVRRDGSQSQTSIYLDFRTHMNPRIHRVQDTLAQHPQNHPSIESLAEEVHMSPRHLTRQFKKETGLTIHTYATLMRMEKATNLLGNADLGMDAIAEKCGFRDARQLRRLWRKHKGCSPSVSRTQQQK